MQLRALAFAMAVAGLCACAQGAASDPRSATASDVVYSGAVTYRERIALPPGAVVNVQLQDVSRADAPAHVLAEQSIDASAGGPPFAFTLGAPRADVEAAVALTIRAQVRAGDGRLLFTSDTRNPAPKQGASGIEVRVVGVPARD